MTPGDYKDVAFSLVIAAYALKWAATKLGWYQQKADEREVASNSHITTQHSNADSLIAEMLRQAAIEARKDYLRLERKMDDIREDFAKMNAINIRLTAELEYSAKRDIEFHDRQLPAILRRAAARDLRIDANRDSINEVRYKLGMPMMGTPASGVPSLDSIPVAIATERDSGHIVSPHAAAKIATTDKD